ncbi:MAG: hypothetical protein V1720_18815 [bacterium]
MATTLTYDYYLHADSNEPVVQYSCGEDIYIGEQRNSRLFGFSLNKNFDASADAVHFFLLLYPQPHTRTMLEEKYNFTAYNEKGAIKTGKDGILLALESGKLDPNVEENIFSHYAIYSIKN